MTKLSTVLIIFGTIVATAQAQLDCSKRPNFKDAKDCCKIPEPKWDAYADQCSKYAVPMQKHPSPCGISCVFNVTNSLQGENLNMDNARTMLSTLFSGNQDFVQAYALGLEKCQPIIQQKSAEFKEKGGGRMPKPAMGFNQDCSPLAAFYAVCAHKNVFTACPPSAWTATAVCENAKAYASSCEMGPGGPGGPGGKRGGGGGFGQRGGGRGSRGSGFHFDRHRHENTYNRHHDQEAFNNHKTWSQFF